MKQLPIIILSFFILLCNVSYGYYQNFDVRTKSDITVHQLNSKLKNKLKGMGDVFISCQEKYGINAVFLAAIAIHESGNGSSKAAKSKNNFFGMMGKKGQLSFKTPQECIECAAKNLTKKEGYYFGRGRYTIGKIARKYASDKKWASRVIATMKSIR
jgi:beta-N-acetylglucosaminidase